MRLYPVDDANLCLVMVNSDSYYKMKRDLYRRFWWQIILYLVTFSCTLLNKWLHSIILSTQCFLSRKIIQLHFLSFWSSALVNTHHLGLDPELITVSKKGQTTPDCSIHGWLKVLMTQFLGFAKYHHFQVKLYFSTIIFKSSFVFHQTSGFSTLLILF